LLIFADFYRISKPVRWV